MRHYDGERRGPKSRNTCLYKQCPEPSSANLVVKLYITRTTPLKKLQAEPADKGHQESVLVLGAHGLNAPKGGVEETTNRCKGFPIARSTSPKTTL